jgi:hypothetical protein
MKIENYDARYFKLNGLPYRKKDYIASFQNIELNNVTDENIKLNTLVNISNKFTGVSILGGDIEVRDFQNASNVNYSSFSTFITDLQTILDDNTLSSVGPTGPTGPQGPAGPAGLYWKGAWVSGTSYGVNDAVGYGGASYFCILATSGTSNPTVATTNWALLASQGAVGPTGPTGATGATGPQGIQGPSGASSYKSYVAEITQTSSQNPIQNVVFNDTGVSIVWSRSASGNYSGTVSASFPNFSKVVVFTSSILGGDYASTIIASLVEVNLLGVLTLKVQGGASVLADDLFNCFIEIRVYN